MLHEIKNINNIGYAILKNKPNNDDLNDRDINLFRNSITQTVELSRNSLDFEKIMLNQYQPKENEIDYLELIRTTVKNFGIPIILDYDNIYPIITDKDKITEIFLNGFINAVKHKNLQVIQIKIEKVENKILTQIINYIDEDLDINFDDLFVPYYMKNSAKKDIWKPIIEQVLAKNEKNWQKIIPHLHHKPLVHRDKLKGDITVPYSFPSTGLGLSIAKMISNVLGGDCGIHYQADKKQVIFWYLTNYQSIPIQEI